MDAVFDYVEKLLTKQERLDLLTVLPYFRLKMPQMHQQLISDPSKDEYTLSREEFELLCILLYNFKQDGIIKRLGTSAAIHAILEIMDDINWPLP